MKFHNGDELTADDVVFSFSAQRVFGDTQPAGGKTVFEDEHKPATAKELPAVVPGTGRRLWPALAGVEAVDKHTVRFHNATPDVTIEGRLYAFGSQIANRRAWDEAATYMDWARKPITTGPYMVGEHKPDVSLTLSPSTTTGAAARRWSRFASSRFRRFRRASTACSPANTTSPATSRRTRSLRFRPHPD